MEIYRYYYGAAAGKGIGVRAQSKALENLPLSSFLKELSSLHALETADHKGEKLCYLLEKDGYSILGLSYLESPKESGYNRTAPCGLQYILPTVAMRAFGHYYGEIVQKVEFKKPESYEPEPIQRFPKYKNFPESGCPQEVLIQIVDGLVKVALSKDGILLIALPKDLKSEYETARAVIGEALNYLPDSLRKNVRFLTGLPVPEGETKCLTGYENAIRLNANVVFCPSQYIKELKVYRSFISVDMANPTGEVGAFASYIVQSSNLEDDLSRINAKLLKAPGKQPYEELNQVTKQLIEEKKREELKEAEAQRRRQAQAQGNGKKRKDKGSSIPDVRTDHGRMDKTSQDIDIPVSGSGRNKNNSNFWSNGGRSPHHPPCERNYQGTDSGRSYPSGSGNDSVQWNFVPREQADSIKHESSKVKISDESEEEKTGVFIKWVIPIISVIAIVGIIILVLPYITDLTNSFKTTSVDTQVIMNSTDNSSSYSATPIKTTTEEPETVPFYEPDSSQIAPTVTTPIKPTNESSQIPTTESTLSGSKEDRQLMELDESTIPLSSPAPVDTETHVSDDRGGNSISNYVQRNCYVKTKSTSLYFRKDSSKSADYHEKLTKIVEVWAICSGKGKDGKDWTEVEYNGKHGYIMTEFLDFPST